jgi:ribosome-binding factor A
LRSCDWRLAMSDHQLERLQEEIKRTLNEVIEFKARDPRIGLVTITWVKLSPDLRYATVYLDFLEGDADLLELFRRDRGFFRSELAKRLDLRYTPELHFQEDQALRRARRIDELLQGD